MIMDELVSGLLAAIEQREEFARDALQRRWLATDNYVEDEDGGEIGRFLIKADARLAGFAAEPESVLRLCRAHRNIIDMYQQAKAQPVRREGREARLRGLDHASAMGRLTTLGLVIEALAEGYDLKGTP